EAIENPPTMLRKYEILVHGRLRFPGSGHGNGPIANLGIPLLDQVLVSPPRPCVDRIVNDLAVHLVAIDVAHALDLLQLHAVHYHWQRLLVDPTGPTSQAVAAARSPARRRTAENRSRLPRARSLRRARPAR